MLQDLSGVPHNGSGTVWSVTGSRSCSTVVHSSTGMFVFCGICGVYIQLTFPLHPRFSASHTSLRYISGQWICCFSVSLHTIVSTVAISHTTTCRKVSEFFLLKDMSRIPNYMWFEYTSVRQETKSVFSFFRT